MNAASIPICATLSCVLFAAAALAQDDVLVSKRVEGALSGDLAAAAWRDAAAVTVELAPQAMAAPMVLDEDRVPEVTVRSINNGRDIAFRLSWADARADRFHTGARFSDAVAVQVPYRPSDEVPITMGETGERVLILHWAAFRQENLENGYADIAKLYPNHAVDWYPHARAPYRYPEDWHNQYALNYVGGEKVFRKNTHSTPVREVVAEGFGTSTWKDVQRADGNGRHADGRWDVVIVRRFVVKNTSNPAWGPGAETFATFAVWDGAKGDRGGRKSLSYAWTPLRIETGSRP